jgi:hypothetical protein
MLFNKKHQKVINGFWIVVGLLVILSMILLYFPVLFSK